MSVSTTLRCAFLKSSTRSSLHLYRKIHCSRSLEAPKNDRNALSNRRPRKRKTPSNDVTGSDLKPFTKADIEHLTEHYTPAQIASIEAGEAAIDPNDLADQGVLRDDPYMLPYHSDDLSKIQPVIDKPVRAPAENYDPTSRFRNEDEIIGDFANWVMNMPQGAGRLEYQKFIDNMRLKTGKEEAERNPVSSLAPEIPRGIPVLEDHAAKTSMSELDPHTKRLLRQTGYTLQDIKSLRIKQLVTHRVVNQTRLGKIQKMYYLTIAGNGKGLLGIGEGKSTEIEDARRQAEHAAIRNLQAIPRYEYRTIYGTVKGKVGAVELELTSRPPGFGIRCQPYIYEMCRCAGISDLAARVGRSRNPMNTIKATLQALLSQRLPDEVARGLGKKLVDVRKVYYGGNV